MKASTFAIMRIAVLLLGLALAGNAVTVSVSGIWSAEVTVSGNSATFSVTCSQNGWCGLGVPSSPTDGFMDGMDAYICDSSGTIKVYSASGHSLSSKTSYLTSTSCTSKSTGNIFSFTRTLTQSGAPTIDTTSQLFVGAVGSSTTQNGFVGHNDRGVSNTVMLTPTPSPTFAPTKTPTTASPTLVPTYSPTKAPTTAAPSKTPTTSSPTNTPTTAVPTGTPTSAPTKTPTTPVPTESPTTSAPTNTPPANSKPTNPPPNLNGKAALDYRMQFAGFVALVLIISLNLLINIT